LEYVPLFTIRKVTSNLNAQVRWHTILIRALDLITVVVPPALPATLSIGTSFALNRLRRSGIFCISPNRINVAGKINVCCFDKTGTLTEDGLDILGIRALDRRSDNRFGELLDNVYDLPGPVGREKANFLYALATCHQLKVVNDEVIGDPLDVKMFQFTKWLIEEGHIAGTGMIRDRRAGEREARPAALVQTIVRPPGSAQFRIEDALKSGAKVGLPPPHDVSRLLNLKAYPIIWPLCSMLTSSNLVSSALSNSSRSFVG
jgi:cation-transporting ATPase 13A2